MLCHYYDFYAIRIILIEQAQPVIVNSPILLFFVHRMFGLILAAIGSNRTLKLDISENWAELLIWLRNNFSESGIKKKILVH